MMLRIVSSIFFLVSLIYPISTRIFGNRMQLSFSLDSYARTRTRATS